MERTSSQEMGGGISITRYPYIYTLIYLFCGFRIISRHFFLQKLVDPTKIERWAVVNFSARCDIRSLVRDLIKCGEMKGIVSLPFLF